MSTGILPDDAAAPVADAAPAPAAPSPEPVAVEAVPTAEPAATVSEEVVPEAPPAEAESAGSLVETAAEPKPEDAPSAEAIEPPAPEPITYEAFNYPEGITVDDEQLTPFVEALGKHGANQEFGQELIDLHTAQLQRYAEHLHQRQIDTFAKTREGWRKDFEASAGNQRDTLLGDAKTAITAAMPDEKDRKALWDVLSFTGTGDHPLVIRAFANLGTKLRERSAPPASLPTNPASTGRPADRRYGAAQR